MKKIIVLFLVAVASGVYAQSSLMLNKLSQAKMQQAATERSNLNSTINSVNSLPEQDLAGAIPVCQTIFNVTNAYVGAGLISEISVVNTCLQSGEKNSVWYSLNCYTAGRLKYMITPNTITDDYDYALYDITGHSYSDIENGIISPLICNFSATGGKTGLDSSGINASEAASGPNFNPLLNIISGHQYMLNISNFSNSTFGYQLDFTGTTANIGAMNSTIQDVISYCGTDSLIVNLTSPILNSSIANNGSDFTLTNSTGTYNVIHAQGTASSAFSSRIVLKLSSLISSSGTFSLNILNGTDGNTLLNSCNGTPMSALTFTFNNRFIYPPPSSICQNQSFTLTAMPANSYTWTGALVSPVEVNNQSLSITTNTYGNFTFSVITNGSCGINTETLSVTVNPLPNVQIVNTSALSCANIPVNLLASGASNYFWQVMNPNNDGNTLQSQASNASPNFIARPLQENIYKVTGTNSNGCSSVAFYTVSVLASPTITILGPDTICSGTSATLQFVGSADSFTWNTGAVNVNTISVSPVLSTNYSIKASLTSTGCLNLKNKLITVTNVNISAPGSSICEGDSIALTSSAANSFTWSTGQNTRTIKVKPTISSVYTLTANTPACGVQSTTYSVNVWPLPNIPISMSSTICTSSSSQYNYNAATTSTGIATYLWNTGSTNYFTSGTNQPYSNLNNVFTLSLTATSSYGCKNSNSLTYTVYPVPTLSISISNNICSSNTATLSAMGASSYTWNPGNLFGSDVVISPAITTNYSVYGKSSNGCSTSTNVTIGVSSSSVITAMASPSVICAGNTASLVATGNGIFKWYKSDTTSQCVAMGLSYTTPTLGVGTYTYYVSSTCNSPSRIPVVIKVLANPVINVATTSTVVCYNTPFQLIANGATTYTCFSPYSLNDTVTVNQTANMVNYTIYGTDNNGCASSASIAVSLYSITPTISPSTYTVCKGSSITYSLSGTPTYTWSNGVVSSPITITPTTNATYSVSTRDVFGCQRQLSFYLTTVAIPTVNISFSSALCVGNSVTLTASGASTYSWSNGVLSASVALTPTVSQTYSVIATSTNGCIGISTKSISPLPVLGLMAPINDTVCYGTSATFSATGAGNYSWSSGFTASGVNNFKAFTGALIAPKTFTLIGTNNEIQGNSYTCSSSLIKTIQIWSNPIITAVATPSDVCIGNQSLLSVTGASSYTWTGGIVSNTMSVVPNSSVTVYNVTGKDNHSCVSTKTVVVNAKFMPFPYLINTDHGFSDICKGKDALLTTNYTADSYTWEPGGVNTQTMTVVAQSVTTTYTLTATNIYPACSITRTTTVNVYPLPTATILSNGGITCANSVGQLTLSSNYSGQYFWSGPGSISPSAYSRSVSVNQPGVYNCTVSAYTGGASNQLKCDNTATIMVNSYTNTPIISISTTKDTICFGNQTLLSASGASTYTWNTNQVTNTVSVSPSVTTNYSVQAQDLNGCIGTATTQITVNSNPSLSITGTSQICEGLPISLNALGATSYTWSNGFIGNNMSEIPTVNTTYYVSGKDLNNCIGTTSVQVLVNPAPVISVSDTTICKGQSYTMSPNGAISYTYSQGSNVVSPITNTSYTVSGTDMLGCIGSSVSHVTVNTPPVITVNSGTICLGQSFVMTPSGADTYTFSSGFNSVSPITDTSYLVIGTDLNGCISDSSAVSNITVNKLPIINLNVNPSEVCLGSSAMMTVSGGATSYSWSTGAISLTETVTPQTTTIYSVAGTDVNNCSNTQTVSVAVNTSCQDVWPGDANSDGVADNLDVLELGLHYIHTGVPRTLVSNSWQSYFADNWTGTITNGKNLNHSDCNGDGVINDDDTLAIYNNYNLTHTFKISQSTTVNPQVTIMPDQPMIVKGNWGTASVYLGDSITNINNINGVAFTVDFDNTLIEPNSVWIEYQNSFIDASQNLYFRKLEFASSKLFTASTHTVSNNVSGYGKIAILHYQILSSLPIDQVLNIGISQANQSDALGNITPLTSGTGTLMAIGASVGVKGNNFSGNVLISPNPTNGLLNISFNTIPQNTKIELYNSIGAMVLTEIMSNKYNAINISDLSNGIYFMKVLEGNKVVSVKKVVRE